jgi:hypothetical protein
VADLGAMLNDPEFKGFQPAEKQQIVDHALKADSDFGKLSSDEQFQARNSIYKTAGIPESKYPAFRTPQEGLEFAIQHSPFTPHSPTEAAVMGVAGAIPFASEAAPALEETAPLVSKALGYLGKSGVGPAAVRTAVTAAAGGATGGVEGAEQGAATGVAGEVLGKGGALLSGARKIANQMVEAAAPAAAEQQAQGAIERRLGMTTSEAKELAAPTQGPSAKASALATAKRTITGARTAARKDVQQLYDPIYDKVDQMVVKPEALGNIAKGARDSSATLAQRGFGPYDQTKPTRDLLDEFGKLDQQADADPLAAYYSPEDLKGLTPRQRANLEAGTKAMLSGKAPGEKTILRTGSTEAGLGVSGAQAAPATPPETGMTIGQLRGRMQTLERATLRPGISENERSALVRASLPIRQTLEDVLPDEQKPILKSINDAYAQLSNAFPNQDLKPLRLASTLPQLGEAFSNLKPDATAMVLSKMSPAEKELTRTALSSYVLSGSADQKAVFNTLTKWQNSGLLKQAGFPDDFQKVGNWLSRVTELRKIRDKPPDLMQTKQFMNGVREGLRQQGLPPALLDKMDEQLTKENARGDMKSNFLNRQLTLWGPMTAMGGYGWMYHKPAIVVPMAAYLARQTLIKNPAYQGLVMNGWTRAFGNSAARLMAAGMVNAAKQYAVQSGWIRPDKEREAEEAHP